MNSRRSSCSSVSRTIALIFVFARWFHELSLNSRLPFEFVRDNTDSKV